MNRSTAPSRAFTFGNPGYRDLGELGLNTFWRTSSHQAVADRIAGVRAYSALVRVYQSGLQKALDNAAGEPIDGMSAAQDLVDRLQLRVQKAEDLVNRGKAAIAGKSLTSNNPPTGTTLEDWQVAYGVDFDEIAAALKAIEEVRPAAEDAMNRALRLSQALQVKRGQAPPSHVAPASAPAKRIDWSDPEHVVRPEVKAAASAVGATIKSAAGGIGFGIVAVLALGAFLFFGRGRA